MHDPLLKALIDSLAATGQPGLVLFDNHLAAKTIARSMYPDEFVSSHRLTKIGDSSVFLTPAKKEYLSGYNAGWMIGWDLRGDAKKEFDWLICRVRLDPGYVVDLAKGYFSRLTMSFGRPWCEETDGPRVSDVSPA